MLYARRSLAQATADAPRALAVHRVRGLNSHARVTPTARRASMVAASTAAQVLVVAAPTISAATTTTARLTIAGTLHRSQGVFILALSNAGNARVSQFQFDATGAGEGQISAFRRLAPGSSASRASVQP